jgi:hypothetical protein
MGYAFIAILFFCIGFFVCIAAYSGIHKEWIKAKCFTKDGKAYKVEPIEGDSQDD